MNKKKNKRAVGAGKNKSLLIFLVVLFFLLIVASNYSRIRHFNASSIRADLTAEGLELPAIEDSTYFIQDSVGRYSLLYSPVDKQARWVAYLLTRKDLEGKSVRRNSSFYVDSTIVKQGWRYAMLEDYRYSTFDRGHLLPSADRNRSREENKRTFLLSNIAPQKAQFNRGVWAALETQVREWAKKYDTLCVVTGGILGDSCLNVIGENEVTIPDRFFKVILSKQNGYANAIGFIIPNSNNTKNDFMVYCVSVREVELATGIDFFSKIPAEIQQKIETALNYSFWTRSIRGISEESDEEPINDSLVPPRTKE